MEKHWFKTILIALIPIHGAMAASASPGDWEDSILDAFTPASGDVIKCAPSESPLFQSEAMLTVNMNGDFPNQGDTPAPATMTLSDEGKTETIPFQMTSRGHARKSYCEFKPLAIDFGKKPNLSETIFDQIQGTKYKLTTHCSYASGTMAQNPATTQNIIKEYFVYKSLQAAGYPTLDVRLAHVYYNNAQGAPVVDGIAFFMEPEKDLVKRCGDGEAKTLPDEHLGDVAPWFAGMDKDILIPFLFAEELNQSWDWVFTSGHNSIPIMKNGKIIAISPYDFNDAALVNSAGNLHAFDQYQKFTGLSVKEWLSQLENGPFDTQLKSYPVAGTLDEFLWKLKVRTEARRILSHQGQVMKALTDSLIADKSAFTAHYEDFFNTLSEYVANGKVD